MTEARQPRHERDKKIPTGTPLPGNHTTTTPAPSRDAREPLKPPYPSGDTVPARAPAPRTPCPRRENALRRLPRMPTMNGNEPGFTVLVTVAT